MVGVRNALPDYQVFTLNNMKKGRNTKTVGWAGVGHMQGATSKERIRSPAYTPLPNG